MLERESDEPVIDHALVLRTLERLVPSGVRLSYVTKEQALSSGDSVWVGWLRGLSEDAGIIGVAANLDRETEGGACSVYECGVVLWSEVEANSHQLSELLEIKLVQAVKALDRAARDASRTLSGVRVPAGGRLERGKA